MANRPVYIPNKDDKLIWFDFYGFRTLKYNIYSFPSELFVGLNDRINNRTVANEHDIIPFRTGNIGIINNPV